MPKKRALNERLDEAQAKLDNLKLEKAIEDLRRKKKNRRR
jgi:hypothetical protein